MTSKSIGIDLDNTLINYDVSAVIYAKQLGMYDIENLSDLRIHLRKIEDLEWQRAQAWIYTDGLEFAHLARGWKDFLNFLTKTSTSLFIVSHKTKFSQIDSKGPNFHECAQRWLKTNLGIKGLAQVHSTFFEPSRIAKLNRINSLNLSAFVDDLPEVLKDPSFPRGVKPILFDPHGRYNATRSMPSVDSLSQVEFYVQH